VEHPILQAVHLGMTALARVDPQSVRQSPYPPERGEQLASTEPPQEAQRAES
jgi:hypothetical protein